MDNRVLLAKAAIDTATLGTGGKMNPQQAEEFMTYMQDYSAFLRLVDFIKMTSTRRLLEDLEVNNRGMRRAKENDDNAPTGTATIKQRELNAVGVIMPYDVTFQFMKENKKAKNINSVLARLFAQQFVNDTVDLGFNGDESSSDEFLNINDGWVTIAENDTNTHKVDNAGLTSKMKLFSAMLADVPSKYFQLYQKEDKNLLKILVSPTVNREYKEELQQRNTALGDSLLVNGRNVLYDGHEIVPVGYLPDNVQMVTPLKNLAYGVYGGGFEVYHDVVPRKTRHEYTLLADFDFEIHNPDALVIAKNRTN